VFVSSHLLPEIEQVCDHVGVMSHGRLVFQGTLAALRQASNPRVRVETSRPDDAATVLRAAGTGAPAVGTTSVTAELVVDGAEPVRTELLAERLVAAGVPVRELVIEGAGLEDLFVGLTGEGFDVDQ
jgi:ABC-2 type transport system ATP-binding protein